MESLKYSNGANEEKGLQPAKKKSPVKIIIAVLLVCIIAASIGAFAYLKTVQSGGKAVTEAIFEYGRTLKTDESYIDSLPKGFQGIADVLIDDEVEEATDVRKNVKEYISEYVAENGLSSIITDDVIDQCVDLVLDDVTQNAEYEVTGVKATFTTCTVTVHTSNVDYAKLLQQVIDAVVKDISDPNSQLWKDAGDVLGNIFQYLFSDDQESKNVDVSDLIISTIKDYYENQKSQAEAREFTGQIVYKVVDGKWTITSIDKELINSFYGIDFETLGLNYDELSNGSLTFK